MLTYFFLGVCDFEKDFCGFTQDKTDKFDWGRNKGKTATPGTGPLVDHTLGSSLGKTNCKLMNTSRIPEKILHVVNLL